MYLKQSDWRKFQGEVSLQNNTLKYQDFILRKKFYLQRSLIILHLCGIENSLRNEACKVNKLFFSATWSPKCTQHLLSKHSELASTLPLGMTGKELRNPCGSPGPASHSQASFLTCTFGASWDFQVSSWIPSRFQIP